VPFDAVLDELRESAQSQRRIVARPNRQGKTGVPPPWAEYLLSTAEARDARDRYERWRQRAVVLTNELSDHGRATLLSGDQRARVLRLFADAAALRASVGKRDLTHWRPDWVAALSLTELLLNDPALAQRSPHEVAAVQPHDSFDHHHECCRTSLRPGEGDHRGSLTRRASPAEPGSAVVGAARSTEALAIPGEREAHRGRRDPSQTRRESAQSGDARANDAKANRQVRGERECAQITKRQKDVPDALPVGTNGRRCHHPACTRRR
jgi:hypothetical protein